MTKIKFSSEVKNRNRISNIVKETLSAFKIGNKIKTLTIKIDKRLKDDINVDYSKLKNCRVTIAFGSKRSITRKSIFHELGHVWDAVKNSLDLSKIKLTKKQQIIGGLVVNLSLDGRLEKMGLPHYSKTQRLKDFYFINKKFNLGLKNNIFLKLWGSKLTKEKTMNLIKQLED